MDIHLMIQFILNYCVSNSLTMSSSDYNHSVNPFAIVLSYYERYKRSMLNSESLMKIANKYSKNSTKLLSDLSNKYKFPMENKISYEYLTKILSLYDIPSKYQQLLNLAELTQVYESKYDIFSADFDVELSLNHHRIISHQLDSTVGSNLVLIRNLVPGLNLRTSTKKIDDKDNQKPMDNEIKEKVYHPFDNIVDIALNHKLCAKGSGPIQMLHNCLEKKIRIQISIRRHKG